jgi:hypothetical protein
LFPYKTRGQESRIFFEKSQVEDEIILRPGPRGDVNLFLILAAHPQAISSGFQACIADPVIEFPLAMELGILKTDFMPKTTTGFRNNRIVVTSSLRRSRFWVIRNLGSSDRPF